MRPIDLRPYHTRSLPPMDIPESIHELVIKEWEEWAANAQPERNERRDIALIRLKECINNTSSFLDLFNLSLTELPEHFPAFLTHIDMDKNQLTQLPVDLPPFLEKLTVRNNHLSSLPENLPLSLKKLYADENFLIELPNNLPQGLEFLYLSHNLLSYLPENLPISLFNLYVCENRLSDLPNTLPPNLEYLSISNNRFTHLSWNLPESLKGLYAFHNHLERLSDNLPDFLERLFVDNNQLTYLSENLPSHLRELHISFNPLIRFPIHLPNMLEELLISDSQLPLLATHLPASLNVWGRSDMASHAYLITNNLPSSGGLGLWSENTTRYTVGNERLLFSRLKLWGNVDTDQWKDIELEENVGVFSDFIRKLHSGMNATNEVLKKIVVDWLNYLVKDENNEVRKLTFAIAKETTAGCVDRASFYFNQMYLLMVENELIRNSSHISLDQVINTIRGIFCLQELEKIASVHSERRRMVSPGFDEDIEIYLGYQFNLREEFSLPVHTELQFSNIARLNEEDLKNAKSSLHTHVKMNFLRYLVVESKSWNRRIEDWDGEKNKKVNDDYLEEISSEGFEQKVQRILKENSISRSDEDACREIRTTLANDLLYKKKYELTKEFLEENNALMLINDFNHNFG